MEGPGKPLTQRCSFAFFEGVLASLGIWGARFSICFPVFAAFALLVACDRHPAGSTAAESESRLANAVALEISAAVTEAQAAGVVFFYDENCPDCVAIKEGLLEPFLKRIGVPIEEVRWLDVTRPEVSREILRLENLIGFKAPTLAPIIVARGNAYCGIAAVRKVLEGE